MSRKDIWAWAAVLAGSAFAASIPFLFYRIALGSWLPQVLPQLESDSLYYLIGIQKVLQGHGSLGNPYFLEYRDAAFPGLILATWLAALPGFLGLTINQVFAFDALFYGTLTGALLYVLCLRVTGNRRVISAVTAVLGVASVNNLIIRPAVMQTVYPVFLLFCLALLAVLEHPADKRRYVPLGIVCAFSFYLYPYLWMIEFSALGLLGLSLIWQREWKTLAYFAVTGIAATVVCIPQILTIVSLFHDPMGIAINRRTEYVATHVVLPLTILNNKYTILLILLLAFLAFRKALSAAEKMLLLLSGGVVLVAVSNFVTGKEMDFITHPWRIGLMVNAIAIAVLLRTLHERKNRLECAVTGLCLALIVLTTASRVGIRMNAYGYLLHPEPVIAAHAAQNDYKNVFAFLASHDIHNSVILVQQDLGFYVPLYTDNTVLFVARAALHVVPDDELLERFLVFHSGEITADFLREHVEDFSGGGVMHEAIYRNAYSKTNVEPIDLIGGEAFIRKTLTLARAVDHDYAAYLKKYHVRYAITDNTAAWNPRIPPTAKKIFSDERFVIYKIW